MLLAVVGLSMISHAQMQVATLQHGDNIRAFYYGNALVEAYNAAVAGDVITLSEGSFTTCTINKNNLTIRGAGIDRTFLPMDFSLGSSSSNQLQYITMEGISCQGTVTQYNTVNVNYRNVEFLGYSAYYNNGSYRYTKITGQFVNCILGSYKTALESTPTFINCLVNYISSSSNSTFVNCVVSSSAFNSNNDIFTHVSFINSILVYNGSYSEYLSLPTSTLAQNCICVTENTMSGNAFSQCVNQNSRMADQYVFSNFSLGYLNPERYRLTASAQAAYIGTDSTQVGLYGGYYPYSSTLNYPVISRMNVARQTTAEGMLNVDIQVGHQQEASEGE